MNNKKFTFIDLFAGIGGFRIPFENIGGKCVFSSEWDKWCRKTYKINFGETPQGDINKIKVNDIPNHDLLLAGFPCQPFSIAGFRKGFDDKRGNLFFKILEIIKNKKPRFFILENVKNLTSHNQGKTFHFICKKITESNYFYKYKILNTKDFGIPQNRERVFIMGFKNKIDYLNFNFPQKPTNSSKQIKDFIDIKTVKDNKYYYNNNKFNKLLYDSLVNEFTFYQIRRIYIRVNKNQLCPTLTANMGTGGHNVPIIWTHNGFRKLTPRECFNLQGFPKSFKLPKIANCYLYKQTGNSVTLNVINELAFEIEKLLVLNENHQTNL